MASKKSKAATTSSILVIDVGGNNVKVALGDHPLPIKVPSGPEMTAEDMVEGVKKAIGDWSYDRVSLGFPGPVKNGRPAREPVNLAGGWVTLDYDAALGAPVRVVNDAARCACSRTPTPISRWRAARCSTASRAAAWA